jgi:hypothetical protein
VPHPPRRAFWRVGWETTKARIEKSEIKAELALFSKNPNSLQTVFKANASKE